MENPIVATHRLSPAEELVKSSHPTGAEYINPVQPNFVRAVKTRYVYLGKGTPRKFKLPEA